MKNNSTVYRNKGPGLYCVKNVGRWVCITHYRGKESFSKERLGSEGIVGGVLGVQLRCFRHVEDGVVENNNN